LKICLTKNILKKVITFWTSFRGTDSTFANKAINASGSLSVSRVLFFEVSLFFIFWLIFSICRLTFIAKPLAKIIHGLSIISKK